MGWLINDGLLDAFLFLILLCFRLPCYLSFSLFRSLFFNWMTDNIADIPSRDVFQLWDLSPLPRAGELFKRYLGTPKVLFLVSGKRVQGRGWVERGGGGVH